MRVYAYGYNYGVYTNLKVFLKTDKVPAPSFYSDVIGAGIIDPIDIIEVDEYPLLTVKSVKLSKPNEDDLEFILSSPILCVLAAANNLYPDKMQELRAKACENYRAAYKYALFVDKGPSDDTRDAACKNKTTAFLYGKDVDMEYHPKTFKPCSDDKDMLLKYITSVLKCRKCEEVKKAALKYPKTAYMYAYLTMSTDPELKAAVCQDPKCAIDYAYYLYRVPDDDLRAAACGDSDCAFRYALYIDRYPRDDTRAAACGDPDSAYLYAKVVDKCPRDDTRAATLCKPSAAYSYAQFIDECARDDTREAASKDPCNGYLYKKLLDS